MRRDISLLGANLVVAGLLAGALGATSPQQEPDETDRRDGRAKGLKGSGEPEAPARA